MKKVILGFIFLGMFLFSFAGVSATQCNLDVSMINQDPYPANPGEYVKLVFQVDGVSDPDCGIIDFELLEKYPLIFDPGFNSKYTINSGTYSKDYSSFFIASYKVRVDKDALDGDNPIEVSYGYGNGIHFEENFNLYVEDTKVDFEVHIKSYDSSTRNLVFEILNIGDSDIEALTVEIPKQESIEVKNSAINIVGDLDSNEYTTADFEAIPKDGEIKMKINYTDAINVRRSVEKTVTFDSSYFEGNLQSEQGKTSFGTYLIWIIILGVIGYFVYKRWKKKKALKAKLNRK